MNKARTSSMTNPTAGKGRGVLLFFNGVDLPKDYPVPAAVTEALAIVEARILPHDNARVKLGAVLKKYGVERFHEVPPEQVEALLKDVKQLGTALSQGPDHDRHPLSEPKRPGRST
jgi:hypothetical protein